MPAWSRLAQCTGSRRLHAWLKKCCAGSSDATLPLCLVLGPDGSGRRTAVLSAAAHLGIRVVVVTTDRYEDQEPPPAASVASRATYKDREMARDFVALISRPQDAQERAARAKQATLVLILHAEQLGVGARTAIRAAAEQMRVHLVQHRCWPAHAAMCVCIGDPSATKSLARDFKLKAQSSGGLQVYFNAFSMVELARAAETFRPVPLTLADFARVTCATQSPSIEVNARLQHLLMEGRGNVRCLRSMWSFLCATVERMPAPQQKKALLEKPQHSCEAHPCDANILVMVRALMREVPRALIAAKQRESHRRGVAVGAGAGGGPLALAERKVLRFGKGHDLWNCSAALIRARSGEYTSGMRFVHLMIRNAWTHILNARPSSVSVSSKKIAVAQTKSMAMKAQRSQAVDLFVVHATHWKPVFEFVSDCDAAWRPRAWSGQEAMMGTMRGGAGGVGGDDSGIGEAKGDSEDAAGDAGDGLFDEAGVSHNDLLATAALCMVRLAVEAGGNCDTVETSAMNIVLPSSYVVRDSCARTGPHLTVSAVAMQYLQVDIERDLQAVRDAAADEQRLRDRDGAALSEVFMCAKRNQTLRGTRKASIATSS